MHNVCDFTLNNAMQIVPKMGDLDALEYPPPAEDRVLNPCLKTTLTSSQTNAIHRIMRFK